MKYDEILSFNRQKNISNLLRLQLVTAVVSIILITVLSIFGLFRMCSALLVAEAEHQAVQIARILVDQQKHLLFTPGEQQAVNLTLRPESLPEFDARARRLLSHFGAIGLKIYAPNSQVIYSTDLRLIGKQDTTNPHLAKALSGIISSKTESKEKACDVTTEIMRDLQIVETYVPLRHEARMIGSMEVCLNVSFYRDLVTRWVFTSVGILFALMLTVFGISHLLLRKGAAQYSTAKTYLEDLATTDMLTDLSNREFLMVRGQEEFERIKRKKMVQQYTLSLGCIMIDIDHFKLINNTQGIQGGDSVLKEIAQRLRQCVRPYDIIGRYGGEEFLVILPDIAFDQNLIVAERIRSAVRDEPFQFSGESLAVTISLGVSCSNENDQSIDDLLKRADEGVKMAKKGGRDRIAWVYHPFDSELHS